MLNPPPALSITRTAREQAQTHGITKAALMDVMRNRRGAVKLGKGLVQLTGSAQYPNIYVTVGVKPDTKQWVVTDIQVREKGVQPPPPVAKPPTPPPPAMKPPTPPPPSVIKPPPPVAKPPTPPPPSVVKPSPPVAKPSTPPPPSVTLRKLVDTNPIVLTKHAKQVLADESADVGTVEQIIRHPDTKQYDDHEKVRFIKLMDGDNVHVIAKFLPDERKWLVITVEFRPEADPNAPPQADISNFNGEPTATHPGIAFTTHALERMYLREVSAEAVKQTILHPASTADDEDDKVRFIGAKMSHQRAVHVIAKFLPNENKWLVVSTWIRGQEDDGSLSTWRPAHKRTPHGKPRVALTNHMRDWMARQGVLPAQVEAVVYNPTQKVQEKDGKVKFIGAAIQPGQSLHVVAKFLPKENKWLVITAKIARDTSPARTPTRAGASDGCLAAALVVLLLIGAIIAFGYWLAAPA